MSIQVDPSSSHATAHRARDFTTLTSPQAEVDGETEHLKQRWVDADLLLTEGEKLQRLLSLRQRLPKDAGRRGSHQPIDRLPGHVDEAPKLVPEGVLGETLRPLKQYKLGIDDG